ncbi:site-specific integrase [Bacillus cihuensis]|uniref:site-specific integrase n=1 Tax=Bacillus cihuensis TaxID=1208599 RepID=UPI0003F62633|nr:site-specific integrase [Bacillus cihuensis]
MPYGYEKHRLSKGLSPVTVESEVSTINHFLAFVDFLQKKSVEVHDILPGDVESYILQERENGLKDSTLNRKIRYIREFFNFLWDIDKIPVDFMPKFKLKEKLTKYTRADITIDYEFLLSKKNHILTSDEFLLYSKMLYIFVLNGVRIKDILHIRLEWILDKGDAIEIHIPKDNGYNQIVIAQGEEVPVILAGIERSVFRGSSYLLTSKKNDKYIPLQLGSLKDYKQQIADVIGYPFRSEDIRFSFVHYLHHKEKKSVDEIQEILGISIERAGVLLKESLERVKILDYNERAISKTKH